MAFLVGMVGFAPVASGLARSQRSPAGERRVVSALDAVVRIATRTCDTTLVGTGTLLADGRVLTAAHVVTGAARIEVSTEGGGEPSGSVTSIERSLDDDVAVLGGLAPSAAGRTVERSALAAGTPGPALVTVAGHPGGGDEAVRVGRVQAMIPRRDPAGPPVLARLDIEVFPGDSGGPVFDADGAVAAMVLSREQISGRGLAAPASAIADALERVTPQPLVGC